MMAQSAAVRGATRKPLIAYTSGRRRGHWLWWGARVSLWLAGARSVRVRPGDDLSIFERVDAVVLGGGDDIGAELYGGIPTPNVRIDPERDKMELAGLSVIEKRGKPILGICRGSQMLNIYFGGSLHEDIYETYVDAPRMRTALPRKNVDIFENTHLHRLLEKQSLAINSLHHQSIDRLGENLRIAARDRSGIVQSVERVTAPWTIGVQWHPELLFYRASHRRLFRGLVDAARQ